MKKPEPLLPQKLKTLPPGRHNDGRGLYLYVSENGARSWVLRYKLNRRPRYMGLGPLDDVSLKTARERATEIRNGLREGIDPLAAREQRKAQQRVAADRTFRAVADSFLMAREVEWRNPAHRANWRQSLEQHVHPVIGSVPVHELTNLDVRRALEPLWTTKTETATRVRGRIERVWAFARALGYVEAQAANPAAWRGNLSELLPKPSKIATVAHFAAMPYRDLHAFVRRLREHDAVAAKALEFLILTVARTGEVRGATWEEFDQDAAIWTIPAARMKAGREHRIPLVPRAIDLLQDQRKATGGAGLVFANARSGKLLSENALLALLKRMGVSVTAHGFRSTFRDWAGETTAHPREVIEHALAHRLKDKAEAAYQRGDLLEKRRRLMSAWADFIETPPLTGEKVVSIGRHKA